MLASFPSEVLNKADVLRDGTGSYHQEHPIPSSLSSFGTRFNKAPWYAELDSTMKKTLSACYRLFVDFELATTLPRLARPTDRDLHIILKHHLFSLSFPNNDLNDPLRRTLFIYTYLRVWHFENFPIMRYIVDHLRQSLLPRLAYLQATAPDLLLWVLFIGSVASQGYISHMWFVNHLREIAVHLGLNEWDEVRPILVEFFYTDQPGYTKGEHVWNKVLANS